MSEGRRGDGETPMMRRPSPLAFVFVSLLIPLLASPGEASVAPSSIDVGVGASAATSTFLSGAVPVVNAGWRLGSRVSLRATVAYLRETSPEPSIRDAVSSTGYPGARYDAAVNSPSNRSAHYVPLGVGLRLYLKQVPSGASRGVFVEAAPTLTMAWLPDYAGHDAQVLRGAMASLGARFGAADGARGEIGVRYYSMERATTIATNYRSYPPFGPSTRQFDFDALALYVSFGFGD